MQSALMIDGLVIDGQTQNNRKLFGVLLEHFLEEGGDNVPRVAIKKKEYMISDLSQWIAGRMFAKGIKQENIAKVIGISQSAFSQRLKNSYFTYGDLLSILKYLDATDEEILRLMKL